MAIAHAHLSLEEFLELPEEEPALEYVNGVITQKAVPKTRHSALQTDLVKRIDRAGVPRRQARAFTELRVTFAGASRVPDVAVFEWSHIRADEHGELAREVFEPPDIAFEVTSPEQSVVVLRQKCLWYVANGVRIAALVDESNRTVLVFRPGSAPLVLMGPDHIDLSEVLPELELTVEELFGCLRRDITSQD